jgi:outer membrane protein OmpA-like peptidoglycan-associated protein/tetratricopeptide (TPR) repeat protein
MKKGFSSVVVALSAVTLLLQGCAGLGSMQKHMEELNFKVEPSPLEVHGDSVKVTITGKFPEKYFAKSVSAQSTPALVWNGGEATFKVQEFKGEKATGNGEVIPFKTGKSFKYTATVPFSAGMESSKLELRIKGAKGSKTASFPAVEIAKGVITTPYLMKSDDKAATSVDKFVRSTDKTIEAVVNFDLNSSVLKPAEAKDADVVALQSLLTSISTNPKMVVTQIEIQGYASPEGEILLNDGLGTERAKSGAKMINGVLKTAKLDVLYGSLVKETAKGEDWEGFRAAMEKSSIADRDIIIRILQRTSDVTERETEIKNITKTYTEIKDLILPGLRRCVVIVHYTENGYTDAELVSLGKTNASALNYEELLKAASLIEDANVKASIYKEAETKANGDYRASNNLGVVYYGMNKSSEAAKQFEKAYGMNKNAETSNNMGVATRLKGDRKAAMKLFNESGSAESKYNKGLILIANGDYAGAVSNMKDAKTFNTALAKMLNGDNTGAKSDLDASGDKSALADYLRAIICARSNDAAGQASNLSSAIAKDGSLGEKSKIDLEFAK